MEHPEMPSNSHKVTNGVQPSKKKNPKDKGPIAPVVTGDVIRRKKSLGRRFKDIFFNGEFKSATHYIGSDVLLPALRNMIVDATTAGIEKVIYGESRTQRRRAMPPELQRARFSYGSVSRQDPRQRGHLPDQALPPPNRQVTSKREVNEIILISREEAELVLERLRDIIDEYDVASVADLCELVGLPSAYTDNDYGWTNLSYATIRQTREGYLLDLPPAEKV